VSLTNLVDEGHGMTVAIFRVPSCLAVNFDLLETLKNNDVFAMYEVRHQNTEVVLYWRQLEPEEEINLTLQFQ